MFLSQTWIMTLDFHKKNPSLCQIHLWCVIKDGNLVRHPAAAGFLRWGAMVTPFTPTDCEQKKKKSLSFSILLFVYYTLTLSILVEEVNISSPSLEPTRTPSWRNILRNEKCFLAATLGRVWPVLPREARDPRRRFEDRTQGNWKTNLQTSAPIWFSLVIDHMWEIQELWDIFPDELLTTCQLGIGYSLVPSPLSGLPKICRISSWL